MYLSKFDIHILPLGRFALLLGCLFATTGALAQQVILNTVGERIVIYPDGSWRYYEEADSVLLDMQLKKEDVFLQDDNLEDPFTRPQDDAEGMAEQMRMAIRFAELTANVAYDANFRLSEETDRMFELDVQLQQATENRNLVEPDRIATLEDALREQTEAVRVARKHHKTLEKYAAKAQDVVELPPGRKGKALNKLMVRYNAYTASMEASQIDGIRTEVPSGRDLAPSPREKDRTTAPLKKQPDTGKGDPIIYAGDDTDQLRDYARKPVPCKFVEQEVDPGSKQIKLVVERAILFTHTDDELRPYFRQQELVTATGQLTRIDDNFFFSIEFSIASPNARKNFGSLERGSLLRLRLLDGTDLDLYNMRSDRGQIDPYTGNTRFAGQYLLEKSALKALERSEVDKMRVVWSAGYEDYEIYEVDFFINQLNCINSF